MVMFIIGMVLLLASLGVTFFFLIKFIKDRKTNELTQNLKYQLGATIIATTISSFLFFFGITLMMNWEMEPLRLFLVIVGSILFGLTLNIFIISFVLH